MPQYCLINDGRSGSALIGTMTRFSDAILGRARKVKDMEKKPGDTADWHHPKYATYLRFKEEGPHTIYVKSPSGVQELTLNIGDGILFLDFKPTAIEDPYGFHPGHWSQAGRQGAVADKWEFSPEEIADGVVELPVPVVQPTAEEVGWELLAA